MAFHKFIDLLINEGEGLLKVAIYVFKDWRKKIREVAQLTQKQKHQPRRFILSSRDTWGNISPLAINLN